MKTVVLFATTTGYQVRAFGDAAAALGVRLVLATDRCKSLEDPWRDQAIPVRFHDEAGSLRALGMALGTRGCDGVLAVGDRPAVLAAAAARAFGVRWHTPESAAASRNKFATRERFRRAGLPVPWYRLVPVTTTPADLPVSFPCVVKPLVLSGSRGVIRADDREGFDAAFARLARLLDTDEVRALRDPDADRVLVEAYIPGEEYAIEGVLDDGQLQVLAVFDKPDPLEGPFFEETIYVTPSRAEPARLQAIERAVAEACRALGLTHGPVHAECRVTSTAVPSCLQGERADLDPPARAEESDRVYVLEVAARPIGGLCARALRFQAPSGADASRLRASVPGGGGGARTRATDSLESLLLRHAGGGSIRQWAREPAASGVMMIPIPARGVLRRVEGLDEARTVSGVEEVIITARPDQLLVPLPEGASYLGFVFASGDTPAAVDGTLRTAHGALRFVIDRPLVVARA